MPARILILLLIAVLALPASLVTPPVAATPAAGAAATPVSPVDPGWVVAAAKKKGKKKNKPKFRTVTVRQPLTQSFTNPGAITIPVGGNAAPYPSSITVSGFANGAITDVNLTLNDFSHTIPVDVDVLLAATHLSGQNAIVMSDVGGHSEVTTIDLTLDDQAASNLPDPLVEGTFRPANFEAGDTFPTQTPSGNVVLSVFNTSNPNGTWQLFVVDDFNSEGGSIEGGWSLQITAEVDVQVQERVKVKKDKKKKRKR